jgi:hypothetical protein
MTQVNQTVLATLVLPLQNPLLSRQMYVSKQMRATLESMDNIISGTYDPNAPKFISYSTHDWTVAQMQLFLHSTNYNFTVVPFAS